MVFFETVVTVETIETIVMATDKARPLTTLGRDVVTVLSVLMVLKKDRCDR